MQAAWKKNVSRTTWGSFMSEGGMDRGVCSHQTWQRTLSLALGKQRHLWSFPIKFKTATIHKCVKEVNIAILQWLIAQRYAAQEKQWVNQHITWSKGISSGDTKIVSRDSSLDPNWNGDSSLALHDPTCQANFWWTLLCADKENIGNWTASSEQQHSRSESSVSSQDMWVAKYSRSMILHTWRGYRLDLF